jgi:hypothetical protein
LELLVTIAILFGFSALFGRNLPVMEQGHAKKFNLNGYWLYFHRNAVTFVLAKICSVRRHVLVIILLLSLVANSFAQQTHIDVAPSGRSNYLPVKGGAIRMPIDSTTSLDSLIGRLSGNWEFVETGKMYWIGYTNDMFSIAARGDGAIGPLINVVEHSINYNAKLGAIYTLHLIGINRKIIGRFVEAFVDTNARKALLHLLRYTDWQPTIMELLIRDPWKSDLPDLIGTMQQTDSDCWAVVAGLNRYKLADAPIHQKIPDNIGNVVLKLRYSDPMRLENNFDFDGQIKEVLDSIIALHNNLIAVDTALLSQKLAGNFRFKLGNETFPDGSQGTSIGSFLDPFGSDMFFDMGNKFQYYLDDGKLYICTADATKKRWINWWVNLTPSQQMKYIQEIPGQTRSN